MAVPNKRERELARAKYERQFLRRQARTDRSRALKHITVGVAVIGLLAGYAFTHPAELTTGEPNPSASAGVCKPAASPRADTMSYKSANTKVKAAAQLQFETNCGTIVVTTDAKAPKTAGIMTWLAQQRYFDGTVCHRVTTSGIFVLQCGDPSGNGSGGPGFQFADENLPKAKPGEQTVVYRKGTVAMANAGANTNGSQFFLVYQDSPLPPSYTVWGTIAAGMTVVDRIAAEGVQGGGTDGKPVQTVTIGHVLTK